MIRVNIFSGEACLSVTDLFLPGPFPLVLTRSYRSYATREEPLGRHWDLLYDVRLDREGESLILWRNGAELHRFRAGAENKDPEDDLFVLNRIDSTHWAILSRSDRVVYHFEMRDSRIDAVAIDDRHGNRIVMERDSRGRLAAMSDPLLRRLEFSYRGSSLNRIDLSRSGSNERRVVFECGYDLSERLSWTADGNGARTAYAYDGDKLVEYTNSLGGTYCARYDERGRCVRLWERDGSYSRQLTYDPVRRTTEVVDSLGYTSLYRFDEGGRIMERVDPLGGVIKYIRNERGELLAKVDPSGHPQTFYHSEPRTRQLMRTDASESTTTLELNDHGDLIAVVDAAGGTWEYQRDDRGRAIALKTPEENTWRFVYDSMGRVSSMTSPEGHTTTREWRDNGRALRILDPEGAVVEKRYDDLGRIVSYRGLRGSAFTVKYDTYAHEIRNVDGTTQRYEFDPAGNVTRFVDERGAEWRLGYDLYGRLTRSTDPRGAIISWAYDGEGRVTSITNEIRARLENFRDPLGRIVRQRNFDGSERTFEYDEAGRLVSRKDGNGSRLELETDGAGRPLVRRYADNSVVSTAYAVANRLQFASDEDGTLEFEYDGEYRKALERFEDAEVRYYYGTHRSPTAVVSGGREIHFEYDRRGDLQQVKENPGLLLKFIRDPDLQQEERTFSTGLRVRRAFDSRGRMATQEVVGKSGASLFATTYEYDERSNRIKTLRTDRELLSFQHNARGELIHVRRGNRPIREFVWDEAGNRTQSGATAYEYGAGSRLKQWGARIVDYDAEGRPTKEQRPEGIRLFGFDQRGILRKVSSEQRRSTEFAYDFFYRRVRKTSPHGEEKSVWSGDAVLHQQLPDGSCVDYVHHPAEGVPLAARLDGEWHALICDQRGELTDVVRLRDETVVWSADSLGFETDIRIGDSSFPIRYRARGQYFDPETGLFYQRVRYYDAEQGRFLTPDPLGVFGGLNSYRFCLNQPFLVIDPLGLQPCPLSEADCDGLFNNIEGRTEHLEQRWEEMNNPAHDLPWQGAPPLGQPFPGPSVGAMGTAIAAGDISLGSIDTHLEAYDQEQRGLQRQIQRYHEGQCSRFEDANRAAAMEENSNWATRSPSLPHLGL